MSDQAKGGDPGLIWRNQPAVNQDKLMNRRTEDLYSSTRWEILLSFGAALLPIGVLAWRTEGFQQRLVEIGFSAIILWILISLYWFRRQIWRGSSRPDRVAATGLEFYRAELEHRRDHLRNGWLWHGPLFLASIILVSVLTGNANIAFRPLRRVLPLIVLLVAWTGFGLWRRRLQANEIQREIDEIEPLGTGALDAGK